MKKKSTSKSAFFNLRILTASALCLLGIAVALFAQGNRTKPVQQNNRSNPTQDAPGTQRPDVLQMVGPVRQDQDLRKLPYVPAGGESEEEGPRTRYPHPNTGAPPPESPSSPWMQRLLKGLFQPATMPPPIITFDGMNLTQSGCGCQPPDSQGDVGPNHYVNAVNQSFKIFDKTGTPLNGTNGTTFNAFFAGLTGTPCQGANFGDPFVFYDHQADRWVISDFAFPAFPGTSFWQCVGVSQSPDPVAGPWALYAVQIDPANNNQLGDYPKMALWNDGATQNAYFLTVNLFINNTTFVGVRAFALNRASMLAGGPANAIAITIPPAGLGDSYSLVPAMFRAGTPPPAGRDEMLLAIDSPSSGGVTLSQVKAWKFHVDFATPANSTLGTGANHSPNSLITVAPFVDAFTNAAGFTIVPQQGTANRIQTLGDKIMTPMVYFNQGGTESLWASGTVCQDAACTQPTGVRWYQFDVTGGNFPATPVQQQTWTNAGDGLYRFMPSISVDNSGNAAVGYSTSSSSMFPGIRYAGRLAGDPPGNLGQGEAHMFDGTGSQTSGPRWGDYSYLSIDPSDNTSFWHVNEYLSVNGANWRQRIGKFNFAGGGQSPTPSPSPSATPTATPGSCTWSAGPDMPTVLVRAVGVFFPANGNFYTMGGRTSDTAGSDFQHALQYTPGSNSWTQKPSTFPDNQMNNMACGVLTVSGTPSIYCVGGSAAGQTTATGRVFSYNPVTDTPTTLTGDDWPGAMGTILPGGFAVANNKLYILGGFNINVGSTNQIWEFDPTAAVGAKWLQRVNTPVGIMYAPTASIGGIIYVGGASDFQAGAVIDTTNSFSFNPVANTIGAIAAIPRATGETRGLNFNGSMYVMGGGRVAPNPSNEVNIYNPGTNTWSIGLPFNNARRNFPTDTNGTDHIWLSGGYDVDGLTPLASMEIFNCPQASPTPTRTQRTRRRRQLNCRLTAYSRLRLQRHTAAPRSTPTPRPRPTPPPRP